MLPAPRINLYRDLKAVHCRQARAALRWTQSELAGAAGVSEDLIYNYEREWTDGPRTANRAAIFLALESAGVEFVEEHPREFAVYLRNGGK